MGGGGGTLCLQHILSNTAGKPVMLQILGDLLKFYMVLDKANIFSQNTPDFWAWPLCLHQTRDFQKTKTVISRDKRTYIVFGNLSTIK